MKMSGHIGVVVIGRNEGPRLRRCLASLAGQTDCVVYVDSGSSDDSVAAARMLGAEVVELDASLPFTAARARNAGFEALLEAMPATEFVQFIDGDCELRSGWLAFASKVLAQEPDVAVVCGRRRERCPERSIYNRMCDWEWDTPVGDALSCGGDALMRVDAFKNVGRFDPSLIAGEEPELCTRFRKANWRICRADHEMTVHDAEMTRFAQWWRRSVRGGHARAEAMYLQRTSPEPHVARAVFRIVLWGLALPACCFLTVVLVGPVGLLALVGYPLQTLRLAKREGISKQSSWERALLLTLVKFPEMCGVLGYLAGRVGKRPTLLIEYK